MTSCGDRLDCMRHPGRRPTAKWFVQSRDPFCDRTRRDRSMKLIALAFLAAISVSACKRECVPDPPGCPANVEFKKETWHVSGRVVDAETERGLPHHAVLFDHFEPVPSWCSGSVANWYPFCKYKVTTFRLITDEKGDFYFSSQIPGMYSISTDAPRSEYCDKSIALGIVKSQRLNIKLALKREPCPMIL